MTIQNISVFFFSPTGNCRQIAQAVASKLDTCTVTQIDLTVPKNRTSLCFPQTDYAIFIFPVYAQSLPDCIIPVLSKLRVQNTPASILSVYGSIHEGNALCCTAQMLEHAGFTIVSAAMLAGSHIYCDRLFSALQGLPEVSSALTLIDKTMIKLENAENLPQCRIILPKQHKNIFACLPQAWLSHMATRIPRQDKRRCTGCRRCIAACPAAAVGQDLSIDRQKCIRCFACVKSCSAGARNIIFKTIFPPLYLRLSGRRRRKADFYL